MGGALGKIFIACCLVVLCGGLASGQDGNDSQARVEQASVGWIEFSQYISNIRGTAERTKRLGEKIKSVSVLDFVIGGESQKCTMTNPETQAQTALCISEKKRYWFHLRRDSPSTAFAIAKLDELERQGAGVLTPSQEGMYRVLMGGVTAPWCVCDLSLTYLIRCDGFLLNSFTQDPETGFFDLHFEYKPDKEDEAPLEDAHVTLWPQNHWSVVDYQAKTVFGGFSGKVEYSEETKAGFRYPKRAVQQLWNGEPGGSELGTVIEYMFTSIEAYRPSDEEFTLTAFGVREVSLGDASRDSKSRSNLVVLFNLFAIVLFVIGYIVMRRSGSKQK